MRAASSLSKMVLIGSSFSLREHAAREPTSGHLSPAESALHCGTTRTPERRLEFPERRQIEARLDAARAELTALANGAVGPLRVERARASPPRRSRCSWPAFAISSKKMKGLTESRSPAFPVSPAPRGHPAGGAVCPVDVAASNPRPSRYSPGAAGAAVSTAPSAPAVSSVSDPIFSPRRRIAARTAEPAAITALTSALTCRPAVKAA